MSESLEIYVKCDGRGLSPVEGTDTDGIKGKCPGCTAMIELRSDRDGNAVMPAHLAGGKTPPPPAGTVGVNTREPVAVRGEKVSYRGNVPSDTSEVPPMVMGRDMSGEMPKPKMFKGREVPTNGTNAGGTGRMHLVTNEGAEFAGGESARRLLGDNALTKSQVGALSRSQQRKYWQRLTDAKAARKRANARQRVADEMRGGIQYGSGPTAARPFGNTVDGVRMDAKPFGVKHTMQAWEDKH